MTNRASRRQPAQHRHAPQEHGQQQVDRLILRQRYDAACAEARTLYRAGERSQAWEAACARSDAAWRGWKGCGAPGVDQGPAR